MSAYIQSADDGQASVAQEAILAEITGNSSCQEAGIGSGIPDWQSWCIDARKLPFYGSCSKISRHPN